jgi:hypothetical protein
VLGAAAGWHTHVEILECRLRDREPSGFWRRHTQLEALYEREFPAR